MFLEHSPLPRYCLLFQQLLEWAGTAETLHFSTGQCFHSISYCLAWSSSKHPSSQHFHTMPCTASRWEKETDWSRSQPPLLHSKLRAALCVGSPAGMLQTCPPTKLIGDRTPFLSALLLQQAETGRLIAWVCENEGVSGPFF